MEKVQRTAARWTCSRWRNSSSVGDMLGELVEPISLPPFLHYLHYPAYIIFNIEKKITKTPLRKKSIIQGGGNLYFSLLISVSWDTVNNANVKLLGLPDNTLQCVGVFTWTVRYRWTALRYILVLCGSLDRKNQRWPTLAKFCVHFFYIL